MKHVSRLMFVSLMLASGFIRPKNPKLETEDSYEN